MSISTIKLDSGAALLSVRTSKSDEASLCFCPSNQGSGETHTLKTSTALYNNSHVTLYSDLHHV